jgi:phage tail-like protein
VAGTLDKVTYDRVSPPSVRGRRPDPAITSKFEVTIEGLTQDYGVQSNPTPDRVSFSKISGIGSSIETIDMVQGSNPAVLTVPKGIKYDDVTFDRGLANNATAMAFMHWYRDVGALLFSKGDRDLVNRAALVAINGAVLGIKRRRVTITLPAFEIALIDAWPVKGSFGDLNANESRVLIHSVTMKYSGIEVTSLATRGPLLEPDDDIDDGLVELVR